MSKIYNFLSLVNGDLVWTTPNGSMYHKTNCSELMSHVYFLEIYIDHMKIGALNKNIEMIQNELFLIRFGIAYAIKSGVKYIIVNVDSNIYVDLCDIIMIDYPHVKILYIFSDGNIYHTDYPSDQIVYLGGVNE